MYLDRPNRFIIKHSQKIFFIIKYSTEKGTRKIVSYLTAAELDNISYLLQILLFIWLLLLLNCPPPPTKYLGNTENYHGWWMGLSAKRDDANIPQQNRANINLVADNWFILSIFVRSLSLYLRNLLSEITAGVCVNMTAGLHMEWGVWHLGGSARMETQYGQTTDQAKDTKYCWAEKCIY